MQFHTPSTFARNQLIKLFTRACREMAHKANPRGENNPEAAKVLPVLNDLSQIIMRAHGEELNKALGEAWAVFSPTADWDAAEGSEAVSGAMMNLLNALVKTH